MKKNKKNVLLHRLLAAKKKSKKKIYIENFFISPVIFLSIPKKLQKKIKLKHPKKN